MKKKRTRKKKNEFFKYKSPYKKCDVCNTSLAPGNYAIYQGNCCFSALLTYYGLSQALKSFLRAEYSFNEILRHLMSQYEKEIEDGRKNLLAMTPQIDINWKTQVLTNNTDKENK